MRHDDQLRKYVLRNNNLGVDNIKFSIYNNENVLEKIIIT